MTTQLEQTQQTQQALTPPAQYIEQAAPACPRCQSEQIDYDSGPEVEGNQAWQRAACLDCGLRFGDLYLLVGYYIDQDGDMTEDHVAPAIVPPPVRAFIAGLAELGAADDPVRVKAKELLTQISAASDVQPTIAIHLADGVIADIETDRPSQIIVFDYDASDDERPHVVVDGYEAAISSVETPATPPERLAAHRNLLDSVSTDEDAG